MKPLALPVISLLFVILIAGCVRIGFDNDSNAVFLRVENVSSTDFSSVLVSFPGEEERFGSVSAGQISEYREFGTAYSYGYIEVVAGGNTYRIQPIDYVGEEPLEHGRYTYKLNIVAGRLELEFERDQPDADNPVRSMNNMNRGINIAAAMGIELLTDRQRLARAG